MYFFGTERLWDWEGPKPLSAGRATVRDRASQLNPEPVDRTSLAGKLAHPSSIITGEPLNHTAFIQILRLQTLVPTITQQGLYLQNHLLPTPPAQEFWGHAQ